MPQQNKGARLWLQPANGNDRAVWVIRDGKLKRRTGCGEGDRQAAERKLASYIAQKYRPARSRKDPAEIGVADVVAIYAEDVARTHARPKETSARLVRLLDFFGELTLANITKSSCRKYADQRGSISAARRELSDLRAAIRYHWQEGLCTALVPVTLPPKTSAARTRWLSRREAAQLIYSAWRYRDIQKGNETARRSLRHVARFILIGLYTGSRAGAICAARFSTNGTGSIDLERGIFFRRLGRGVETNKRQPTIRIPPRLLAHLRRWHRTNHSDAVIEWNGASITKINKGFRSACNLAGLGADVIPHTLRHTCATWLAQRAVPIHEICGFLGMTPDIFNQVYGHHHPDYQLNAVNAFNRSGGQSSDNLSDFNRSQRQMNAIKIA